MASDIFEAILGKWLKKNQSKGIKKLSPYIGGPGEVASKAIADIIGSYPEYGSGFGIQNGYTSLLHNIGIDDLIQSEGDLASNILGLSMSLVDPLNPTNKLSIKNLTRLGQVTGSLSSLASDLSWFDDDAISRYQ